MTTLGKDFRHAVRRLARSPGFTAVAGLTLALTLGANTAVFSVMNGVLLRALPFPAPDRIVDVALLRPPEEGRPGGKTFLDGATLTSWRESGGTIDRVAAYRTGAFTLTGEGPPRRIQGARVSPELFPLLGVRPLLGRPFDSGLGNRGPARPVVLSHGLWQRRFAGDREILGTRVTLDGEPHTVVAVMPRSFVFPDEESEVWLPLELSTEKSAGVVNVQYLPTVARLADGISTAQARAELQALWHSRWGGSETPSYRVHLVPLREEMVAEVRPALLALFAAVGLVLLIGCANLANLVLARTASRQQEMAVRLALGGGRGRVVRQVLTETTVLALAGGALGLLLAFGIHHLLPWILPSDIPRLEEVRLDTRVFLFTFGLSVLTGLLFGLWPALRSARTSVVGTLRGGGGGRVTGGRRSRRALIVAEVALAVVLLIGAGLLLRSFLRLVSVEPGYEPDRVMTATVELDRTRYSEPGRMEAFFDQLLTRLEDHPDVAAAGVVSYPPLTSTFSLKSLEVLGRPPARTLAVPQLTSPGYRSALGMRLAAGRWLSERDHLDGTPAAIVNQTFVRDYLGDDALGERLRLGSVTLEVVGIVEDVRLLGLERDPQPELFTSYRLAEQVTGAGPARMTLLVRTERDAEAWVPFVRSAVLDLDPALPLEAVGTLRDRLSGSVARPRFYALLLSLFALLALLLAAAGIYGVLAYQVAQRSREIGIRRALGAQRSKILRGVLREGLVLVVVGLGLGLLAAVGATRVLGSLLFGVPPMDPWSFGLAPALLVAVGALACYLPARRATRVEPVVALRWE